MSPSCGLKLCMNCYSVDPSHGVQFFTNWPHRRSLPRGEVLQKQAAPPWISHGVTSPAKKTCSGVGSSLHGAAGPGRSLLQCGLPVGTQLPSGNNLLLHGVTSVGYRLISAPPYTSMGCRGTTCLMMVFHHKLQGKNLCSGILSTSFPSFFTDLGVCRVISFTSSHSCLSTAVSPQFFLLTLLNYVITEVLPLCLVYLALTNGRSVL